MNNLKDEIFEYMNDPPFVVTLGELENHFGKDAKEIKEVLSELLKEDKIEVLRKNRVYAVKNSNFKEKN